MRIIAGEYRGRTLQVPKALTRPTTDRVRESLFGQLGDYVEGAEVLDLFAGAGGIGTEALSRGAAACDFVELDRIAARTIEQNLKSVGCAKGRVHQNDVETFLKRPPRRYRLIFADPPYADGFKAPVTLLEAVTNWRDWLEDDGYFFLEQEAREQEIPLKGLQVDAVKKYGKSRITRYRVFAEE